LANKKLANLQIIFFRKLEFLNLTVRKWVFRQLDVAANEFTASGAGQGDPSREGPRHLLRQDQVQACAADDGNGVDDDDFGAAEVNDIDSGAGVLTKNANF
jgi:hypothetical protein